MKNVKSIRDCVLNIVLVLCLNLIVLKNKYKINEKELTNPNKCFIINKDKNICSEKGEQIWKKMTD